MTKQEIKNEILIIKFQMNKGDANSPHYKDLKRHLKKLERKLKNER